MIQDQPKIGFIGAGNMACALIKGLLDQGYNADLIYASDPDTAGRARAASLGATPLADNVALISQVQWLVLAVKPQLAPQVLVPLVGAMRQYDPLVLSVMAGISVQQVRDLFQQQSLRIIRTMPNTPALVGAGATALYGVGLRGADKAIATAIMTAVGLAIWVDEEQQLDAVTALSGSGPAYFLLLMEAMIEAATALGLTLEQAHALTLQTAYGTALLQQNAKEMPAELRAKVTSPGGTTEAALQILQSGRFSRLIADAMTSARDRCVALGSKTTDANKQDGVK